MTRTAIDGAAVDLRYYLALLRRRWIVVLTTVLAATTVAGLATPKSAEYASETVIYVGLSQYSPTEDYSYDPTLLATRLMQTYAVLLDSELIATEAVRSAGADRDPEAVVEATEVTAGKDTQLLTVRVVDERPEVAQSLAKSIADAFIAKVQQRAGARPGPGSLPSLPAYVFQPAELPTEPEPSQLPRNLALAAFFGLLVAGGLVLLLDHLDVTVRSPTQAEEVLGQPVLGFIPYNPKQTAFTPVAPAEVVRRPVVTRPVSTGAEA